MLGHWFCLEAYLRVTLIMINWESCQFVQTNNLNLTDWNALLLQTLILCLKCSSGGITGVCFQNVDPVDSLVNYCLVYKYTSREHFVILNHFLNIKYFSSHDSTHDPFHHISNDSSEKYLFKYFA